MTILNSIVSQISIATPMVDTINTVSTSPWSVIAICAAIFLSIVSITLCVCFCFKTRSTNLRNTLSENEKLKKDKSDLKEQLRKLENQNIRFQEEIANLTKKLKTHDNFDEISQLNEIVENAQLLADKGRRVAIEFKTSIGNVKITTLNTQETTDKK